MTAAIRFGLATSMLASLYPLGRTPEASNYAMIACVAYVAHAIAMLALLYRGHVSTMRAAVWMDLVWIAVIVALTGGVSSLYFLGFLFPVLVGSFSRGFEEGALLAIVSAGLLAAIHLALGGTDLPRLLMRMAFLLSLGYASAYWGEAKLQLRRRLELLRDLSNISNPRFGAERTIQSLLWRICRFYDAGRCVLVVTTQDPSRALVRKASRNKKRSSPRTVERSTVASLLGLHADGVVFYARGVLRRLMPRPAGQGAGATRWQRDQASDSIAVADLLDARNFISLPVSLHGQSGRIFVTDVADRVKREDAEFLFQIVAQAFPVIDTIEMLDQLATQAATDERKRVALDLHDSAIQPYIGIRLGLNALRRKADIQNPLNPDIDTLISITDEVITDLRRIASSVVDKAPPARPLLHTALQRNADQLRRLYGLELTLQVEDFPISDRMVGQIASIVQEGLSNICRHTLALRGEVTVGMRNDTVDIRIINDCDDDTPSAFTPRSITERVRSLGGKVSVSIEDARRTIVQVQIPV